MTSIERFDVFSFQAEWIWKIARERALTVPAVIEFANNRHFDLQDVGFISSSDKLPSFEKKMMERLNDVLYDRILFPIRLPSNKIVGFASRALLSTQSKWLYCSLWKELSSKCLVYGLDWCMKHKTRAIFLTEGIGNVHAFRRVSAPAIALFGSRLEFEQAAVILSLYREIVLCYDNDPAGRAAAVKALFMLALFGVKPRIVFPSMEGLDPEDSINQNVPFRKISIEDFLKSQVLGEKIHLYNSYFTNQKGF